MSNPERPKRRLGRLEAVVAAVSVAAAGVETDHTLITPAASITTMETKPINLDNADTAGTIPSPGNYPTPIPSEKSAESELSRSPLWLRGRSIEKP